MERSTDTYTHTFMGTWKLDRFLKYLSFVCKLRQLFTPKQNRAQSILMEIRFAQNINNTEFDKKNRNEYLHELHHSKMVTFYIFPPKSAESTLLACLEII